MNREYVLCYAHPLPHAWYPEVLLIQKQSPVWQQGLFNLPGGKIEPGETPEQAAARELWEETGINCHVENVHKVGLIDDLGATIHICICRYDSLRGRNKAQTLTNEAVVWMPFNEAFDHPALIKNLKIIIPLCRSGLRNWVIRSHPLDQHVVEFSAPPKLDAEAEQLIEFECEPLST